jgi:hypothetical protein
MTDATMSFDPSFFTWHHIAVLAGAWFVYKILQALYYVSPLHPLSGIPGPKLAAATYLPEFYYDVVKFGCYTKIIQRMHEQYGRKIFTRLSLDIRRLTALGPIVRINPHEVHCNDARFSDEIYAVGGRKRNKPLHQVNGAAYVIQAREWKGAR